ncbi:MAG TPA: PDZ domain-containing protein, partial [Planctomycetota bacterium]|nr:PDZ domain-containing protein [Planctomycetota bacterium]
APAGIDPEGLDQRILSLPNASGEFVRLVCTKDRLFILDGEPWEDSGAALKCYDLEERKLDTVAEGVNDVEPAAGGDALLWRKGTELYLADSKGKDPKRVPLGGVRVRVDPGAEWEQILREVWRLQRDWFYDPNMHGVDWPAMLARWSPFLAHVRHRDDLNVVIAEMMGELACGHEYLWGGDAEKPPQGAGTGLLGADWEAAEGRYRIRRVLRGQNWNDGLRAPLTEPGVDARAGDFLISVDGRPVTADLNLDAYFEGTAGRQVEVVLSARADGSEPRTSKVVPVDDESRLRRLAWVEERRALVDRLTGGSVAYVYMPDTGPRGLAAFERDFYSQVDRKGLVLDERYNGGGKVADHVVEVLSRKVHCWWLSREGWVGRTPWAMLDGPKAMVINEYAGSGGDAMPWMFRRAGLGPLVGTRTWGGLVGISWYPPLVDGGRATAAAFGVLGTDGKWAVENEGVAPDHEVVETPADSAEGRDPQLEKAVALVMEAMKTWKYAPKPAYAPPTPR